MTDGCISSQNRAFILGLIQDADLLYAETFSWVDRSSRIGRNSSEAVNYINANEDVEFMVKRSLPGQ